MSEGGRILMKNLSEWSRKLVGTLMALILCLGGIPMDIFAMETGQVQAEETVSQISVGSVTVGPDAAGVVTVGPDSADMVTVGPDAAGMVTVEPDAAGIVTAEPAASGLDEEPEIHVDSVTGETERVENPYPLDILIIEPDPEYDTENAGEAGIEESAEEESAGSPDASISTVSGQYTYSLSNEKAVITKYDGNEETVNVPEVLDGYPVEGIGNYAFQDNSSVKTVNIPSSVKSIGS